MHTHTHTHTHLRKPRFWCASTGPGQVTSKEGARGRINILKVLKATGPGQVSPEGARPGLDNHSQKLLDRGRCRPKGRVRGWIAILKSYWPGAGVARRGAPGKKKVGLNGRTGAGVARRGGVRFGTKAGLKPVHDGTIFYSIYL